jgi:hypothetical protein
MCGTSKVKVKEKMKDGEEVKRKDHWGDGGWRERRKVRRKRRAGPVTLSTANSAWSTSRWECYGCPKIFLLRFKV